MTRDGTPGRRRVELYVRSLRPDGYCRQQSSVFDRLAGLEERGAIGEWAVKVCGCQVPATRREATTAVGQHFVEQLTAFREWAIRNDRALTPTFEVPHVRILVHGGDLSARMDKLVVGRNVALTEFLSPIERIHDLGVPLLLPK